MRGFAFYFGIFCLCAVSGAYGQTFGVEGIVIDSATQQPVPFVSIMAKGHRTSTLSSEDGRFSYPCYFGDTIVFYRLGYQRKSILALQTAPVRVLLREIPRLLESVTIFGSFKPQGLEQWKLALEHPRFENPGARISNDYMQTVGAGVSIGVQFDYFSKEKRERRKLVRVQEELDKTRVFRRVVEDPETKRYLMNLFQITEEEYKKKLEAFNRQMTDAHRAKTRTEVIDLLVGFFAIK